MKQIRFSLMLILLLGIFCQPCFSGNGYEQQVARNVDKMSEAEMRAILPEAKKSNEKLARQLKRSRSGWEGNLEAAVYTADYEYNCALIAEIEKRLRIIDAKKEKEREQRENEQKAREQKQQEKHQEDANMNQQKQEEFQQSVNEKLESSQSRYSEYKNAVNANAQAAREGNVALDLVTGNKDPNFKPISSDMLDQPQQKPTSSTSNTNKNISNKFQRPPKKEQQEEKDSQNKNSNEDFQKRMEEIKKRMDALRNSIKELPDEE